MKKFLIMLGIVFIEFPCHMVMIAFGLVWVILTGRWNEIYGE